MSNLQNALRPLGALEHMFAAYGENGAMAFSVVATIAGDVTEQRLRDAVMAVAERHPLLRATLGVDDQGRAAFLRTNRPIPLKIVQASALNWEADAAEEVGNPLNPYIEPLMRVRALVDGQRTTFIISFHHSAVDGISGITVLKEILLALGGASFDQSAIPESVDTLQGLTAPSFSNVVSPNPNSFSNSLVVKSLDFEAEETAALINMCKKNDTTVHSMLAVALSNAHFALSKNAYGKAFRIMSPLDFKPLLRPADDVSLCISIGINAFEQPEADFWEAARSFHENLHGWKSREVGRGLLAGVTEKLVGDQSMESSANRLGRESSWDCILSNVGVAPVTKEYGNIVLEKIWAPVLRSVPGEDAIGAATYSGALRLVHTINGESNDLLQETAAILRALR